MADDKKIIFSMVGVSKIYRRRDGSHDNIERLHSKQNI